MKRTVSTGHVNNLFTDNSYPDKNDLNAFQEEIVRTIEGAGLTPDDADLGQLFKAIKALVNTGAPVGGVIAWMLDTVPSGYLECDGSAVSRATYADLYAVIGVKYGPGNGSTTFNLPDLRGEFLRGWDHAATHDPNAATRTNRGDGTTGDHVGTKQADENKSHKHGVGGDENFNVFGYGTPTKDIQGLNAGAVTSYETMDASGGAEARPRNVAVMYVIRY